MISSESSSATNLRAPDRFVSVVMPASGAEGVPTPRETVAPTYPRGWRDLCAAPGKTTETKRPGAPPVKRNASDTDTDSDTDSATDTVSDTDTDTDSDTDSDTDTVSDTTT